MSWQLIVNTDKTKIMIFNKAKYNIEVKYRGNNLDIVTEYTYLRLLIHKSGSFSRAIHELAKKAQKAYFNIQSMLRRLKTTPKVFIKLFDTLVRPILLYGSDVWGGFGHLRKNDDVLIKWFEGVQYPYETRQSEMADLARRATSVYQISS